VTRTRPLAFLAAGSVAVLVLGATVTLLVRAVAAPHLVVGVVAAALVGLVCVAGARAAGVTRTPYW
jgi:hypothetical protein